MWLRRSVSLQPLCSTSRLFFPHMFYRFWCDSGGVSHSNLSALLVGYSFLTCFTGVDVNQEECLAPVSLLYWSVILSSHVLQVLMWLRRSVSLQPLGSTWSVILSSHVLQVLMWIRRSVSLQSLCSTSQLFFPHMFYRFWCDSGGVSRSSLSALLVSYSFLTCFTGVDVNQEECLAPASLLYWSVILSSRVLQVLMWTRRSVLLQHLCSTGQLFFPLMFYRCWCEPGGVSHSSLSALLVGYSFLTCFTGFDVTQWGVSHSSLSDLLVSYSFLTCFTGVDVNQEECLAPVSLLYWSVILSSHVLQVLMWLRRSVSLQPLCSTGRLFFPHMFYRCWCESGGVSRSSLSALLVGYSFLTCFTGFDVTQEECLTPTSRLYWSVILSSHVLQVLMWIRRSVSLQSLCSTSQLFFPHMFYRFWCDSGGVSRSSLSALLVSYSFLTCFTGVDVNQEECLSSASLLYWSVILSSHVLQVLMWTRRSVSVQPLCSTGRLFFPDMFYRFWCEPGGVSRFSLSALLVGYSFLTCFTGVDVNQEECLAPASLLYWSVILSSHVLQVLMWTRRSVSLQPPRSTGRFSTETVNCYRCWLWQVSRFWRIFISGHIL